MTLSLDTVSYDDQALRNQDSANGWDHVDLYDETMLMSNVHDKHALSVVDREEPDNKRQETSGDSGKKKPGRKPILNEPTTKRKAQNRAAQRAFRERKENHVKELQDRVAELEQQNHSTLAENQFLWLELQRLRKDSNNTETSFAPSQDFVFEFPATQSLTTQSSSSASQTSPSDTGPTKVSCPSLCSSNTSPQSAVEDDFVAAAMPHFSRQENYAGSRTSSHDSGNYSASIDSNANLNKDPLMQFSDPIFQNPELPGDLLIDPLMSYNFNALDYRSNDIFDSFDIDPPLIDSNPGTSGLSHQTSLESQFVPIKTTLAEPTQPSEFAAGDIATLQQVGDQSEKILTSVNYVQPDTGLAPTPCPEVWRKIVSHPKFASFNLDELCTEFSKKAKCSQTATDMSSSSAWFDFDKNLDEFAARQEQKW